jgi:rhodanese-related sulfurtransferase
MEDIYVQELKQRLDQGEDLIIIDVREPWEYEEFNIGALNVPLSQLPSALLDWDEWKDREVIVHCKSGARSAAAKALLTQQGFSAVRNLLGGMMEWQASYGS